MRIKLLLVAAAVALLGAAGSARADNPGLVGDVGLNDAYTISLTDAAGARVTHLDPGTYTLTVHDHSDFHNFHLSGPGVDASTAIDFIGDQSFTVTFTDGTYFFNCDPHSSRMKGTFTVGTVAAPPPPAPAVKLSGSIGPGGAFSLGPVGGRRVPPRGPGTDEGDGRRVPGNGDLEGRLEGRPLQLRQRAAPGPAQGLQGLRLALSRGR